MKFTTSTVVASTLAVAAAQVNWNDTKPAQGDAFRVMAIRSGSEFHYADVAAYKGGLSMKVDQDSRCGDVDHQYATFFLSKEGDLYLYTPNPPLEAYVDRSGMGQGVLQFTTGVQPIGRNQERGPFKINADSNLVFQSGSEEIGFQACPNGDQGYSIWMEGNPKPAYQEGCLPFIAKALKEDAPVKCLYEGMSN
ncbi:copper amine oxidase [Stemphylium lycopersici]|uniref:Copper amine oxidase n=1 Tax=Stemphylium lycopersici TaxID=183478 RepID=A0A364N9N8_STELY|nr:hypothetical protein TW65_91107 [Stemphylium lycopersici]RAQ98849.1 copper amine oxidase [Stemphylium lycopersici]RAR13960.1 copper amine oxidase [Stemphylium lycopersici]